MLYYLLYSLERCLEKENALYLKGGPKDSAFSYVCVSPLGVKSRTKGIEKKMNQIICENGGNKVIRCFPFTGLYLRTWKFVKCIQ